MKRLWPKLSTSMRPKTSVSPEAAMKMIIPIARPATVSVSQVDDDPTTGQAASAIAAIRASGRRSKRLLASASAGCGAAGAAVLVIAGSLIDVPRATGRADDAGA